VGADRAETLDGGGARSVVVTFRSPTSAETFDRLARIYDLTLRERASSRQSQQVMTHLPWRRLSISPLTAQDHLKAVFDKTCPQPYGVRVPVRVARR
jgi:hypothetical protein